MPQPARRPGHSRRAQYGIFFTYLAAIAGMGIAALFLLLSALDPRGADSLRMMAVEATAPVARTLQDLRRWIGGPDDYFGAVGRARELEREVSAARMKLVEARAVAEENRRLKELLNLVQSDQRVLATGRLVSGTASSVRRIAAMTVSDSTSLVRGQPVRAPEGLVGRILSVGPTTARVLLITDTESVVPVKRVSDGLPAMASGLSNGRLMISPLDVGLNPFRPHDQFVTSGNGGLFPPDIPVVVVLKQYNEGALGQPFADPASVGHVAVLPIFEPDIAAEDARQAAAEPPRP